MTEMKRRATDHIEGGREGLAYSAAVGDYGKAYTGRAAIAEYIKQLQVEVRRMESLLESIPERFEVEASEAIRDLVAARRQSRGI